MKGSYILVIWVRRRTRVKPGSLPAIWLSPGCYLYVGSARGPGGFEKRVLRHVRKTKKARWHIDYLTRIKNVEVRSVFYAPIIYGESTLTGLLSFLGFRKIVRGFGSTDCQKDFSHLFLSNKGFENTVRRIRMGMSREGFRFKFLDEEALIRMLH